MNLSRDGNDRNSGGDIKEEEEALRYKQHQQYLMHQHSRDYHHHVQNPPFQQQLTPCTSGKKRKPLQPLTNDNKSTLEQRQKKTVKPAPSSRNIVVEVDLIPDIADLLVEEIIDSIHDGGDGVNIKSKFITQKKVPKQKSHLYHSIKEWEGQIFDPPTMDAVSTKCVTFDSWKKMKDYCDQHPNLTSPIPPASDGRLEDINTLVIHFPGVQISPKFEISVY